MRPKRPFIKTKNVLLLSIPMHLPMKQLSLIILAAISLQTTPVNAQKLKDKADAFYFGVYNNQTYMPFVGMGNIFTAKWHPGLLAGVVFDGKAKKQHTPFTMVQAGFFYHRFLQSGIQLYASQGTSIRLNSHFSVPVSVGAGYFHSFTFTKNFKMEDNGEYKATGRFGRPQAMIAVSAGLGYHFNMCSHPAQLQLNYQPWMQLPFIKSYVPMLPNNALVLGLRYNLAQ